MDLPINFKNFFDFEKIKVEVGFGFGEFIFSFAKEEKKNLFVGIEKYGLGMRKLLGRLKDEGLDNLCPLSGDCFVTLQVVFDDNYIDCIFVNFPDPWPKKRHKQRRILNEEFFNIAKRKLKEGGKLYFATDDENLANFAVEEIKKVDGFINLFHPNNFSEKPIFPYKTRYETKWLKENKKIFYFLYEKEKCPI